MVFVNSVFMGLFQWPHFDDLILFSDGKVLTGLVFKNSKDDFNKTAAGGEVNLVGVGNVQNLNIETGWFEGSVKNVQRMNGRAGGLKAQPGDVLNQPMEKSRQLPFFEECFRWLDIYFSGRQPDFTPAYRTDNLTPFRRQVQKIMLEIPWGQTVTYGGIASRIAAASGLSKMSAQAVGGAVGWNPLCLIIPCHRVMGAGGKVTGYGGGIKNKIELLKLEKIL